MASMSSSNDPGEVRMDKLRQMIAVLSPAQLDSIIQNASNLNEVATMKNMSPSIEKTHSRAKAINSVAVTKGTRPLNSWIAFRSFYRVMFSETQQKDISAFLKVLWQYDPFKAKWSILAKAYSIIRDSTGKLNAPLNKFLLINVPFIGIIVPENYLLFLGWEIVCDIQGAMTLNRKPEYAFMVINQQDASTNISVKDIIEHSITCGYVMKDALAVAKLGHEPTMAMATFAQAVPVNSVSLPIDTRAHTSHVTFHNASSDKRIPSVAVHGNQVSTSQPSDRESMDLFDDFEAKDLAAAEDAADKQFAADLVDAMQADLDQSIDEIERSTVPHFVPDVEGSLDIIQHVDITNDTYTDYMDNPVSLLRNDMYTLGSDYPFDSEFDPEASAFTFDPLMGSPFNTYNIGDYFEPIEEYDMQFFT